MASMFDNSIKDNSVSISVTYDDLGEQNRLLERVRRKRKKQHWQRVKDDLARRVTRFLLRYWMILIFLPAAALLVFEALTIARGPSLDVKQGLGELENLSSDGAKKPGKISLSNLNRIDPPGCLKLLSPEEIERLDIPMRDDFNSPVKNVVYLSDNGVQKVAGNITSLNRSTELKERDSIYLREIKLLTRERKVSRRKL